MKNANFQELYRKTYSNLGFDLKASDRFSEKEILAAENKLGVVAPRALRDYYLAAGKEKKLNTAFNRLLSPQDWEIHQEKIVFMVENQRVVVWGTDPHGKSPDPQVFQSPTFKGKLNAWYDEGAACSAFLTFILHLQSAYGGGMPHLASAPVTREIQSRLDDKWHFIGEIGGMRTYSGPGQAICFMKFPDFFTKTDGWRIFAGASDKKSLDSIAQKLEIDWD